MNENQEVVTYWQQFPATLPEDTAVHAESYTAESFGDSPSVLKNGFETHVSPQP